jgi:hypothetical protein
MSFNNLKKILLELEAMCFNTPSPSYEKFEDTTWSVTRMITAPSKVIIATVASRNITTNLKLNCDDIFFLCLDILASDHSPGDVIFLQ